MAGKGNKSLTKVTKVQDEEKNRMVNLEEMEKVFSEMFKSHEKSVLDILAANNKIQNDRLDILTKHIEGKRIEHKNFKSGTKLRK